MNGGWHLNGEEEITAFAKKLLEQLAIGGFVEEDEPSLIMFLEDYFIELGRDSEVKPA